MQAIATTDERALERNEQIERQLLAMPQADCPVAHHFGPGVYVRELSMKAGTWAIGHHQKFEHLNVLLQGAVRLVNEDGSTTDLRAPLIFTGKPGRKVGFVLEDMVWLNIYAADERDVEALEVKFIEKSRQWLDHEADRLQALTTQQEPSRVAFAALGLDDVLPEQQRSSDLQAGLEIRQSAIHGRGVFVSATVEAFQAIGHAVIGGARTQAGQFLNHSDQPNALLVRLADGDVQIVTLARVRGPQGGQPGDEVTIDYQQAATLFANHEEALPCQ